MEFPWRDVAPLPVVVPLGMAAVLAGLGNYIPRRALDIAALLTAVGTVALSLILAAGTVHAPLIYWFGGWKPDARHFPIGIGWVIDPISAGLAAFVALQVTLALLFSWKWFRVVKSLYHVLMLVFLGGMCGLCLSGDIFNLFVWFELMTAAAVALCGYKVHEEGPLQGALNFAVSNSIGAYVTLVGIGFVYAFTGSLNFAGIAAALAARPPPELFLACVLVFVCAGFLVKSAAFPFHFWLADAHAVAPTPVSVLFSGIMVELGIYAVARIYFGMFAPVFAPHVEAVRVLLLAGGAATALLGAMECFLQHHLKRLLAFSTISHVGLMLIALGLLSPAALAGFLLYAFAHGLIKACLFICAGILLHRFGSLDEHVLHGQGASIRGIGVLMAVAALGLMALPPYGTFFASNLVDYARHSEREWIPGVYIFCGALTGGAVLRFALRAFFGVGLKAPVSQATPQHEARETRGDYDRVPIPMALAAGLALVLGVLPVALPAYRAALHTYAAALIGTHLFSAAVLGGPPASIAPSPLLPKLEYWPSLTSLGFALLLVWSVLVPVVRRGTHAVFETWRRFQHFQTGRVGDYVAWLVAGLAAWAALLAMQMR